MGLGFWVRGLGFRVVGLGFKWSSWAMCSLGRLASRRKDCWNMDHSLQRCGAVLMQRSKFSGDVGVS